MSRKSRPKPPPDRISLLFADLAEQAAEPQPTPEEESRPGQSPAAQPAYRDLPQARVESPHRSHRVADTGSPPVSANADKPKGYLAKRANNGYESNAELTLLQSSSYLTPLGKLSLTKRQLFAEDAQDGKPATLAIPASIGEAGGSLLLELFDASPERIWSDDERSLIEQVTAQLCLTLENARLIQQTNQALDEAERRARELAILNEMSRELVSNLQVDSIISIIYRYVSELMDASNFYVALYNPNEQLLTFHHVTADGQIVDENHPEWEYWSKPQPMSGLTAYVIQSRQPLLIENRALTFLQKKNLPFIQVGSGGAESWLGVPMMTGDQVLGVITVQSETQANLYNAHHCELLTTIGNQAAIAIQNARLLEETRQRNEELAAINHIISAANRSLDLSTMLETVLSQLLSTFGYEAALVCLFNPIAKRLYVVAHQNLPDELVHRYAEFGLSGSLAERVFTQGDPLELRDLTNQQEVETYLLDFGFQFCLGVPLESKGKTLGALCFLSSHPQETSPSKLSLLQSIAQQVGVAVDNARLFEQTQKALAETEILYNASARMNRVQTYQDIIGALSLYSVLGQADISLALHLFDQAWKPDRPPEKISVTACRTRSKDYPLAGNLPFSSLPSLQEILRPDRAIIIHDLASDVRLDEFLRKLLLTDSQAKSAIFVPLVASGHWIGFISSVFSTSLNLEEREIRRLSALADLAAVAIQNIHLLQESRRRADQLQTAAIVARDTSSTLALDKLLDKAVNLIREGFGYSHASIFLLDESGANAVVRASTGEVGKEMLRSGHFLPVGSKSIIGYVTQACRPYVVNNVREDPIHFPNPLLPETRSEAGIPLQIGSKVIGALDVQSNQVDAFSADDVAVLQILADQIAVAVDNARAYELSVQAIKEMKEADELKSQFLANMSHELRTPLNSIIGFSRVILKGIDGPVTELQQQDLTAIHNAGQHLLNLINDILDLSKIEAGKMELTFEENVNLADLINSVMSTVVGLVKDKPIKLVKNIAPDLPLLRIDPTKVRQILLNLFSNAAKFTEEGSISIDAHLQVNADGKREVLISVTDTGCGIAPEDQKKLFQPFSQVDPSPTRKTGGSGLGLSICRHLVEMHGGQIGLKSQPGKGSTFYFTLPVHAPARRLTGELSTGFLGPIVLSIDDEAPVIGLYQRYLANHGYKVYPLTDPSRAVEIARKLQPIAITLDIVMPDYNGWQVLQDLKSNPETRDIPVIICSITEEQGKGFSLGATDYLMKPILEEDLVRVINRIKNKESAQSVLVVEDNPDDQKMLVKLLQEHKFSVTAVNNGQEAQLKLHTLKPQLMILDLSTSQEDGYSVLETMKMDAGLRHIPVIIIGSSDPVDNQIERLGEFAQAMLKKGMFTEKELLGLIEQSLRRYCRSQEPKQPM